jgi:hypothetical protein
MMTDSMVRIGRLTVPKIDFPVRGGVDTFLMSTDPLSPSAGESVKQLNPRPQQQTSDFEDLQRRPIDGAELTVHIVTQIDVNVPAGSPLLVFVFLRLGSR